jgi:hypothetical protein
MRLESLAESKSVHGKASQCRRARGTNSINMSESESARAMLLAEYFSSSRITR